VSDPVTVACLMENVSGYEVLRRRRCSRLSTLGQSDASLNIMASHAFLFRLPSFVFFVSSLLCAQELATRSWAGRYRITPVHRSMAQRSACLRNQANSAQTHRQMAASNFPIYPGDYKLEVTVDGVVHRSVESLRLKADSPPAVVTLSADGTVAVAFRAEELRRPVERSSPVRPSCHSIEQA